MLKKKLPFIIPASLLALAVAWIAFISVRMSFVDFRVMDGIWGSEAIGFANYARFFNDPHFWRVIRNTLVLGFQPIIAIMLTAAAIIWCIHNMPKRWMKCLALAIIAIPAFMPTVAIAGIMRQFFCDYTGFFSNSGIDFLMDPSWYRAIFAFAQVLQHAFFPVILGLFALNAYESKVKGAAIALGCYALFRLAFILSPDFEFILLTYNPITRETADVIQTWTFRTGIAGVVPNQSLASAVWVMQTIAQLIFAALAGIGLVRLGRKLKLRGKIVAPNAEIGENSASKATSVAAILVFSGIAFLFMLPILHSLAVALIDPGAAWYGIPPRFTFDAFRFTFSDWQVWQALLNSTLNSAVIGVIFAGFALLAAYPLLFKTKWYWILLALPLLFNHNIVGEYLFVVSAGLLDNPSVIWLTLGFNALGAFVLYLAVRNKFENVTSIRTAPTFAEYFKVAWKPALFLIGIAFAFSFGELFRNVIYISSDSLLGIGPIANQLIIEVRWGQYVDHLRYEAIRTAMPFVISFIPVTLGVTLIWLAAFRKTPILSLFSAGAKN